MPIIIFGASGDLTRRKLVPALHTLSCGGMLHPVTRVVGVARTPLSDQAFRARLREGVDEYAAIKSTPGICELWDRFAERYSYRPSFGVERLPDAYGRLLLGALQGDASLFARSDEIEEVWRLIDPLLRGWESPAAPPLVTYQPGSWGPAQAEEFMAREGRLWCRGLQ